MKTRKVFLTAIGFVFVAGLASVVWMNREQLRRWQGPSALAAKVQEFAGSISGEVDGTPYVGDFKVEPHK